MQYCDQCVPGYYKNGHSCISFQKMAGKYEQQFKGLRQNEYQQCSSDLVMIELRRKLHQSRSQNFTLQQQLCQQIKYAVQVQEANTSLKSEIQQNLLELTNCGKKIQKYHTQLIESKQYGSFLYEKIQTFERKLSQTQLICQNQKRYVFNLDMQNQLLISIKQVLTNQNITLKDSYHQIYLNYQMQQKQLSKLALQMDYLLKDIRNLEQLLQDKNQEIINYQTFLNNKDHQLKEIRQFQIQKEFIDNKVTTKIDKYKRKALKYKHQRDYLLKEIHQAKDEIGNITLRKYLQSQDPINNLKNLQKYPSFQFK